MCVMIWSRSYYSITLLSSVQRQLATWFVKTPLQIPHVLFSVIKTYVIGLYCYIECTISHHNNINAHICVMTWSCSYYSIKLLSSVQCQLATRFVKIPLPNPMFWLVVKTYLTHNLTSISAPCNVHQHDLSQSPSNSMFLSVIKTYVIGLYRYVEHTISHQ